jgi:prolyl oligopeptidase
VAEELSVLARDSWRAREWVPCEVFMGGGGRLFWALALLLLIAAAVYAGDDGQTPTPSGPPKAEARPLEENFHGTKVLDKYRWLEDGNSPETRKWVAEEMAYTRALLDPLSGRDAIHKRLTELLSIGNIGVPRIGGKYHFYTRRQGLQNPACAVCAGRGGW